MRRPGSWLALALGFGALALAIWFLTRTQAAEEAAVRPPFVLPVTLCTVERGDLGPRTRLTGNVRAARRARIAFEVSGTVRELLAEEAEAVEAGAVVARLDRVDEELELASAEADLALARRQQELLVAGERPEEKRRLAAVLDSAQAEEDLARSEVARGEKLLESRVVSESEQDRRVSELRVAEKRRVAAEEQLARAMAGTRNEDLAIAAARVDESETRLARARHELEKTELHAPWAGRVVARFVSVGDYVDSGDSVYELLDLDHLEIHLDVPGRLAAGLGPSSVARVRLPGNDGRSFESRLDALVPAADEVARSFRAILRLGPGDAGLTEIKPGQFLDVELLLEPLRDVLLVPTDCVLSGEGGQSVVRAASGAPGPDGTPTRTAEFVAIHVLGEEGGRSAIEPAQPGTLAAGDALLLTGADNAFPSAPLLVREPESARAPAAGAGG